MPKVNHETLEEILANIQPHTSAQPKSPRWLSNTSLMLHLSTLNETHPTSSVVTIPWFIPDLWSKDPKTDKIEPVPDSKLHTYAERCVTDPRSGGMRKGIQEGFHSEVRKLSATTIFRVSGNHWVTGLLDIDSDNDKFNVAILDSLTYGIQPTHAKFLSILRDKLREKMDLP